MLALLAQQPLTPDGSAWLNAPLSDLLAVVLMSVALPLAVTVLTKCNAPSYVKNWVHAALSVVAGVAAEGSQVVFSGEDWDWQKALFISVVTWVMSTLGYEKLWKNSSVNNALSLATGDFGVGGKRPFWPTPEPGLQPVGGLSQPPQPPAPLNAEDTPNAP